ncbi:hypothetical protein HK101_000595 [Irineochytrium annulatum]|nr:hypothetical protein HK101_000595 [Irineochytrium annulatum]
MKKKGGDGNGKPLPIVPETDPEAADEDTSFIPTTYFPKPSKLKTDADKMRFLSAYVGVSTLVSTIISGAAGYGISMALYKDGNPQPHIRTFAGTLPGDIVVTLLIQNLIGWITTAISIFGDLRGGMYFSKE